MEAIVYENGSANLTQADEPTVLMPNEVIVRIRMTGICGTDLNVLKGNFDASSGVIMGHEAVASVVKVGDEVSQLEVGQRVVVDPTMWCGNCEMCRRKNFNLCDNKKGIEVGLDYPGTFAKYAKFPAHFLYPVPDSMPDQRAVMIEPFACVMNNFDAAEVTSSDAVLVLGGGPIGGLCGLYAIKRAAKSLVLEVDSYRVEFLNSIGIRSRLIDKSSTAEDLLELFMEETGRRPNVVIDTTGVLMEAGIKVVEKGGAVVSMGFNRHTKVTFNLLHITNNAIRIIGAGDYNATIQKAIDSASDLEIEKLVSHRYALSEYKLAFDSLLPVQNQDVGKMGGMKVVFDIESERESENV